MKLRCEMDDTARKNRLATNEVLFEFSINRHLKICQLPHFQDTGDAPLSEDARAYLLSESEMLAHNYPLPLDELALDDSKSTTPSNQRAFVIDSAHSSDDEDEDAASSGDDEQGLGHFPFILSFLLLTWLLQSIQ